MHTDQKQTLKQPLFDFQHFCTSNSQGSELADFAEEYFKVSEDGEPKDNNIFFQGIGSILTSKSTEDSLVS